LHHIAVFNWHPPRFLFLFLNVPNFPLSLRTHSKHILMTCKEVGRKPPTFTDASIIAGEVLNSGYEFDQGTIIYNTFKSVIFFFVLQGRVLGNSPFV